MNRRLASARAAFECGALSLCASGAGLLFGMASGSRQTPDDMAAALIVLTGCSAFVAGLAAVFAVINIHRAFKR